MVVKAVLQWKNPFFKVVAAVFLFPFSFLFFVTILIRNLVYGYILKPAVFQTPVIAVGSLSAGGSGKTPLVEFLAMQLTRAGRRVAVITNGYKKKQPGLTLVSDGHKILVNVNEAGDEAFMLAVNFQLARMRVPVIACSDRVKAMRLIEDRFDADAVILDDAFQYRKLGKNIELVVQDFYEMKLPAMLLPVGRWRDLPMSLKRADGVVIAKTPESDRSGIQNYFGRSCTGSHYNPVELVRGFDGQCEPLEFLAGKKIVLFSGLGYPESFERTVNELCRSFDATIECTYEFQDHHRYRAKDLKKIISSIPRSDRGEHVVLTTQKDMVKINMEWLPEITVRSLFYLKCKFTIHEEDRFIGDLIKRIPSKEPQ